MLEGITLGLTSLFEPQHFLVLLIGVFVGFTGGALPGVSGTMLIIIVLPITYGMEPISAFILLTTIYVASVFSGMITAILFRVPGTPESVATVFDGFPMTQQGKPGQALGIAVLSSATGGMVGAIFLIFLAPVLANIALQFSAPEYFALAVLGLTVVATLSSGDMVRGLIGVTIGLFIATIGMDPLSGIPRFTFNSTALLSGVDFIPILTGLFAVSEVLRRSREDHSLKDTFQKFKTKIFDSKILRKISGTLARSSLIGSGIGILPGVGATTAAMLSYSEAVRWSKTPEKFGKGNPEGIAAPESANNSAAVSAMVPLLALGLPGGATTAVILGAFIMHGLQPGPMLFSDEPQLVYTIIISMLVINILMIIFAKPFITVFSKIMNIPYTVMGPAILLLCMIGTFAVRNSMFDIWVMLFFGILGLYFDKIKFPLATIILGIVLGPIAEEEFRRGLLMSGGDFTLFFTRPISAALLAIAFLALVFPIVKSYLRNRKKNQVAN